MMELLLQTCPNTTFSGFLTLTEVSHWLPRRGGKRVNVSTIYRWTRGLRGVRLECWRIGRTIVTTETALRNFFAELVKADSVNRHQAYAKRCRRPRRTNDAARQKSLDEANAILVRAGIITAAQVEAIRQ